MAHSLQTDLLGIADRGPSSAKGKPVSEGQGDAFRKLLSIPEGEESLATEMQAEAAIAKELAPDDKPKDLLVPAAAMSPPAAKPEIGNNKTGDINPSAITPEVPAQAKGGEAGHSHSRRQPQISAPEPQASPANRSTDETVPAPSDDAPLPETIDEPTVVRADRGNDTVTADKVDAENVASAGASQTAATGAAAIANSRTAKSEAAALTGRGTASAVTQHASETAAETPRRAKADGSQQVPDQQPASGEFDMPPRLDQGAASPPPVGALEAADQPATRSVGGDSILAGLPTTPGTATTAPQPPSPVVVAAAPTAGQVIAAPEDVVDIIRTRTASGEPSDRITVQLDPPELGRVSIDFKFDAQGLQHVTITGDSPEALRQLRQLHFQLTQALEQQGLTANDMSFRQNSSQHGQSQTPGYLSIVGRDEEEAALAAQLVSTSGPRRLPDGSGAGLNIKL